jgi:hypothetical protein
MHYKVPNSHKFINRMNFLVRNVQVELKYWGDLRLRAIYCDALPIFSCLCIANPDCQQYTPCTWLDDDSSSHGISLPRSSYHVIYAINTKCHVLQSTKTKNRQTKCNLSEYYFVDLKTITALLCTNLWNEYNKTFWRRVLLDCYIDLTFLSSPDVTLTSSWHKLPKYLSAIHVTRYSQWNGCWNIGTPQSFP